ncbi:hypothetical protein SEA_NOTHINGSPECIAL_37 [Mycobacterium phage NothingSpecial]|nr:hypothetical protein SEA_NOTHINGSPECIAL_37 [Mycobacterium phage NothingSpecial]
MRISLHIWRFEILLWFRRKPPVPRVVVADPDNYETVRDIFDAL